MVATFGTSGRKVLTYILRALATLRTQPASKTYNDTRRRQQKMAELFANIEVNREPGRRFLLGLLGGSLALHLALAAGVIYAPTLLDAVGLASLARRADYVDKPYNKTVVGEEVRIVQWGQKFHYPDGYFAPPGQLVNPLEPPKIISQAPPPRVLSTPMPIPSPLPSPSPSTSPGGSVVAGNNKPTPNQPTAQSSTAKDAATDADKNAADESTLGVNDDEINTRPLKDWLARANALKEKGLLDLTSTLEMTIDATLNPGCNLADAKVVQKSGDPQMVEIAKDLASAISDSRMLLYFKDPAKLDKEQKKKALKCDPMSLRFTVKLDQNDFDAKVETEADSPDRAAELTRAYNFALAVGEIKKRGHDEEAIFKNTKVTSQGKQIIVHFNLPRQNASELLKKQVETKPAS
jgi:hypothetical protein